MGIGVKNTYTLEGKDGIVYVRVWKKRYAKQILRNEEDREYYKIPNEGICYKIKKNGEKKFAFIW